jgi:hypothetical protein
MARAGTQIAVFPATLAFLARFTSIAAAIADLAYALRDRNAPLTRGSLNVAHLLV